MLIPLMTKQELSSKKKTLRLLQQKREDLNCTIAEKLGITGYFLSSELNLEDPRVEQLKLELQTVNYEINRLYWEIEEQEALKNDDYPRFEARKKVNMFLSTLPDKVEIQFLKSNNLTTLSLVEKVIENPDFLEETYSKGIQDSMNWLPVVRVEKNTIFVKTIRGIEPCRKANGDCDDVKQGDYALCRSIHNHLFMLDYSHVEVES